MGTLGDVSIYDLHVMPVAVWLCSEPYPYIWRLRRSNNYSYMITILEFVKLTNEC